jgi:hypothetical protein
VQVCVVTSVTGNRRSVLEQAHHLGVDGEELLDEGTTEMQQGHLKAAEVFGNLTEALLDGEVSDERADLALLHRVIAALDTGLDSHDRRDPWQRVEACDICEVVGTAAPADRLPQLRAQREAGVLSDGIAQCP